MSMTDGVSDEIRRVNDEHVHKPLASLDGFVSQMYLGSICFCLHHVLENQIAPLGIPFKIALVNQSFLLISICFSSSSC